MATPLVTLQDGTASAVIQRNLPEPVAYQGENLVEIDFSGVEDSTQLFLPAAFEIPGSPEGGGGGGGAPRPPRRPPAAADVDSATTLALTTGFFDPKVFPNVKPPRDTGTGKDKGSGGPPRQIPRTLQTLPPEFISQSILAGQKLYLVRLVDGSFDYRFVAPPPTKAEPRIYIVEVHRLSTQLGRYGAGRVVKTFSLLPGEKTKISVRTFRRSEALRKASSSILDSVTEESAVEFQNDIETEQSDTSQFQKSFEYHAEAEAKASWGFGSAKVSGGVKGTSNAAREEFAKNVSKATERHAAKASAKRDMEVNTSTEVTEISEEEQAIEREIENINASRTLNFVFRQMNQEFFTFLHLIDIRVAFFNGHASSRREVPLYQVQDLLDKYVKPASHDLVRRSVLDAITTILDYKGNRAEGFVEEVNPPDSQRYFRVSRTFSSQFKDSAAGSDFVVPGVLISASTNVMRTDGLVVESLLGESAALDSYATRLQELEVERRAAEVASKQAEAERLALGNQLVSQGNAQGTELLVRLQRSNHPEESPTPVPDAPR